MSDTQAELTPYGVAVQFPSIVKLMDDGVAQEVANESKIWNTREWKGTPVDRYPLSPSQIGKCSLALARNLAHFLGLADYPRAPDHFDPRTKRIFARGALIESALVGDLAKFTPLKLIDQQKVVTIFKLADGTPIKGSIDGILVSPAGRRVLVDFKSKGAFYSAAFKDSIAEFFAEMRQTGLVHELAPNAFFITDAFALFNMIKLEDFFVDYLLQLNSYALSEELAGTIDFVTLYYENKNTCGNYEVRWLPDQRLLEAAKNKYQRVYDAVRTTGPESVKGDFELGSARCRLCDYNENCWGKYERQPSRRVVGTLSETLDKALRAAQREHHVVAKVEEDVLNFMRTNDLTHIQTSDGLVYERKFLKSPKEHYELRLTK